MVVKYILLAAVTMSGSAFGAKSLVYCSEGSPSTFNPQVATDGTTYNATRAIYNRLVEFEYGKTNIVPSLAESWDISEDGKTYTFRLRKDVSYHKTKYFSPTRLFNADDVVFSFDRQRLKTHSFHAVGGGSYEYFNGMAMGDIINDIIKVDSHTVKFVLNKPEAPFLADLAMDFASILSAEYGAKLQAKGAAAKIDFEPVGTGPFIFKRYVKDQVLRLNANSKYFKGKPNLDKLIFSITTDPSVRYQKLKTGECDFVTLPAPQDIEAMRKNKKIVVMDQAGLNVGYLGMNVEKKPFDNVKVRQAINHALNRSSYIDAIYLGNAIVAKNPLPPTIWSYNDKTVDYDFNIAKSKKLLKEAGFPNGFETEIWTLPVSRPYNPNGKKMGEMMQADLAKVGIKVKLVSYDWPTYLAKSKNGEHAIVQLGWTGDNGDPDNFLNVLLGCAAVKGGSNRSRWCNKDFEKLTQQAKIISDPAKRAVLYEKAQLVFKKEAPWVTLAHSKVYRAMSSKVKGYKIDPFGGDYFDQVDVED